MLATWRGYNSVLLCYPPRAGLMDDERHARAPRLRRDRSDAHATSESLPIKISRPLSVDRSGSVTGLRINVHENKNLKVVRVLAVFSDAVTSSCYVPLFFVIVDYEVVRGRSGTTECFTRTLTDSMIQR
jgi:hypothetical protein